MNIVTENAPSPGGHYVQAFRSGNMLFISGQLSFPPAGPAAIAQDFKSQAIQAFRNVEAILKEAALPLSSLVQLRAYITGVENWPVFDEVCEAVLGTHKCARAVVPVPELHYGCKLEIEAVASYENATAETAQ